MIEYLTSNIYCLRMFAFIDFIYYSCAKWGIKAKKRSNSGSILIPSILSVKLLLTHNRKIYKFGLLMGK